MSRTRTARIIVTLLLGCAAVVLLVWAILPQRALVVSGVAPDPLTVRGSVHVHTLRSDGTGTVDDVAAAARRAGLQFVVLTDHGDGTRDPDPPAYRSGVLVIDAVEISTMGGHYVALGLARAPYRLAGEPRDVVEDVARLGGFGIVAHPDSPKVDLRWRDWTLPFDGIEWLNADSEWRNEGSFGVARALVTYWWRSPETVTAGFDRPDTPFAEWDTVSQYRRVIGLAGHDAHARIGPRGNWEPGDRDLSVQLPGYEAAFRAFAVRVSLEAPLTGDAGRDAAALLAQSGPATCTPSSMRSPRRRPSASGRTPAHAAPVPETICLSPILQSWRRTLRACRECRSFFAGMVAWWPLPTVGSSGSSTLLLAQRPSTGSRRSCPAPRERRRSRGSWATQSSSGRRLPRLRPTAARLPGGRRRGALRGW